MADCCNDKACEIDALRSRQGSILKIVLGINAVMFIVELIAGLLGHSVSQETQYILMIDRIIL